MKRLQAVKALTYATRRLLPGDTFEARSPRDHKVLLATKKVREHRDPVAVPAPSPAVAEQIAQQFPPADDVKVLRDQYTAAVGRQPFYGWSADVLRAKIAEAKSGANA